MPQQLNSEVIDSFFESSNARFEDESQDNPDTLNIVVIGRVSSGKSSLINALLGKTRKNSLFKVRAESGVTSLVRCLRLNDRVRLIESPGLDDVRAENSTITQKFLERVDVGIFVVDGSSDARQKKYLDDLNKQCADVFVVLNKIDEYDKWKPLVLERVIEQWQQDLGIAQIYPTCTFGYDPEIHPDMKLDLRGIDRLQTDIEKLLQLRWQQILKIRAFNEKRTGAIAIITNAMLAIAAEACTPKHSPYIAGTLAIAIAEIQYLFLGQTPSGTDTHKLLALFTSDNPCAVGFLWQGSDLAPDFGLNLPTAKYAIASSLAILMTFVEMLRQQAELTAANVDAELRPYRFVVKEKLANTLPEHWQELSFWQSLVPSLLSSYEKG